MCDLCKTPIKTHSFLFHAWVLCGFCYDVMTAVTHNPNLVERALELFHSSGGIAAD